MLARDWASYIIAIHSLRLGIKLLQESPTQARVSYANATWGQDMFGSPGCPVQWIRAAGWAIQCLMLFDDTVAV